MKEFTEPLTAEIAVPNFEVLTLPLLPRLQRYALRLTGDPAQADDLVQTTYLNGLRGWGSFRPGSDPARWLFTICRHAFYRSHRRAAETVSLDAPELESMSGTIWMSEAGSGAAAAWSQSPDVQSALDTAIAGLPVELRGIVLAVDVEGYNYEEAAGQVGIPVGTVRSRLYRARRMLQEKLVRHAEDLGVISGGAT